MDCLHLVLRLIDFCCFEVSPACSPWSLPSKSGSLASCICTVQSDLVLPLSAEMLTFRYWWVSSARIDHWANYLLRWSWHKARSVWYSWRNNLHSPWRARDTYSCWTPSEWTAVSLLRCSWSSCWPCDCWPFWRCWVSLLRTLGWWCWWRWVRWWFVNRVWLFWARCVLASVRIPCFWCTCGDWWACRFRRQWKGFAASLIPSYLIKLSFLRLLFIIPSRWWGTLSEGKYQRNGWMELYWFMIYKLFQKAQKYILIISCPFLLVLRSRITTRLLECPIQPVPMKSKWPMKG